MMKPTRGLNLTKSHLSASARPTADEDNLAKKEGVASPDAADIADFEGSTAFRIRETLESIFSEIGVDVRNLASRRDLLAFIAIAIVSVALISWAATKII